MVASTAFPASRFADEEVLSNYGYRGGYSRPKGITEQTNILRQLIPGIGYIDPRYAGGFGEVSEKLAAQPLPPNAEGWFAIPRWQSVDKTYGEALQKVLDLIKRQRGRFFNWEEFRLGVKYLKHFRRYEQTQKSFEALGEAQKGYDILVVAAQFGLRHRGRSVRRSREVFEANEFGLGSFEVASMVLTHPERLADYFDLAIWCAGDEYAPGEDGDFSSAPMISFFDNKVCFDTDRLDIFGEVSGSASAFLPVEISE